MNEARKSELIFEAEEALDEAEYHLEIALRRLKAIDRQSKAVRELEKAWEIITSVEVDDEEGGENGSGS